MQQSSKIKRVLKKILPKTTVKFLQNNISGKPINKIPKILLKFLLKPYFDKRNFMKLDNTLKKNKNAYNSLYSVFNGYNDEFLLWFYNQNFLNKPNFDKIVPRMPDEHLQLAFTGLSGEKALKEAFSFFQFIKYYSKQRGLVLNANNKILDFGCGWGRIIRFFMKDVPAYNIYGIDCDEDIIKVCQDSNLNCNFSVNEIFPPTEFADNSFDLIYSFSVFSHLSEEAHIKWLKEFKRILRPNGLLIVTTRHRDFIKTCAKIREEMSNTEVPFFATGPSESFLNTTQSLMEYDSGKYVYEPVGGGGLRDGSFYGETCIPEKYVNLEWIKYFSNVRFIDYKNHKSFDQNAIIAQK